MLNTPDVAGVFLLCLEKLRLYIAWLSLRGCAGGVAGLFTFVVIGYRATSNAINEVLVLESSIYDRHIIMRK